MGIRRAVEFLQRQNLGTILALGLAARIAWIAVCPNEPISDQTIYYTTADRLAHGDGYVDEGGRPFNYWPVGYPALLAPFFAIFGTHSWVAHAVNAGLGLALIAGVFEMTRLSAGRPAAALAATFAALNPTLVLYTTCIASENAFMPGIVWMVVCFLRSAGASEPLGPEVPPRSHEQGSGWIRWALFAGVVAGATLQVRGTTLLTFGSLPLALLLWRRTPRVAVLSMGLFVAAMLLTTAPWSLRNQKEFGRYSPLSFNGNANLWMGNHVGTTGGYVELPAEVEHMGLLEREEYLGLEVRRFWREHPGAVLPLALRRTRDTLKSDTIAVVWNEIGIGRGLGNWAMTPLRVLTTGVHWILLVATGVSMIRLLAGLVQKLSAGSGATDYWRLIALYSAEHAGELLLFATMLGLAFPFVFMVSGNRYHVPAIPIAMSIVAIGLSWRPHPLPEGAQ